MRKFSEIYDIAAGRKGGHAALEALLTTPATPEALAQTTDDRWLSCMAKCLFQAGFNWTVINTKWPGFEEAFDGFDPARVGFYHDEDVDRLLSDPAIVRNGAKINAVLDNARFIQKLRDDYGSVGRCVAEWPNSDYVGLLQMFAKEGARLGSVTGQRIMRSMGRDSFILSSDGVARLIAEGVVSKPPSSKRDMAAVQDAFNTWADQSGRGLTHISQILAYSV